MRAEPHRLPHLAYFEALAAAPDESSLEWRTAKAGFVVLRLVDHWVAMGAEVITDGEWRLHVVRRDVRSIGDGHPLREALMAVLDAMYSAPERLPSDLFPHLMAYAHELETASQRTLATDVYETIIHDSEVLVPHMPALVVLQMRLGACLGKLERWKDAIAAYKDAEGIAKAIEDDETAREARRAAAEMRRLRKARR